MLSSSVPEAEPPPVPPRATASVPVHPSVKDVEASNAIVGDPPSAKVTFVSSVLVSAEPAGAATAAHVPSPRQNVEDDAEVPLLRLVTGKLPATCVVRPILPQFGKTPTPPEISALPVATSAILESEVVVSA